MPDKTIAPHIWEDVVALLERDPNRIDSITELPTVGIESGYIYSLTVEDGYAPKGFYTHDGTGWICLEQHATISKSWSAAVSQEIISGVTYEISITANITSLAVTLSTSGSSSLNFTNASAYTITPPTVGSKRGIAGLDALASENAEIILSLSDSNYTWSSVELVAL